MVKHFGSLIYTSKKDRDEQIILDEMSELMCVFVQIFNFCDTFFTGDQSPSVRMTVSLP